MVLTGKIVKKLSKVYQERYDVDPLSDNRRYEVSHARHCLIYVIGKRYGLKPLEVGRLINKHRTTYYHSVNVVEDYIETKDSRILSIVANWNEIFSEYEDEIGFVHDEVSHAAAEKNFTYMLKHMDDMDRILFLRKMISKFTRKANKKLKSIWAE